MQQDNEVERVEFIIKVEPEKFESAVVVQQTAEQKRNSSEILAETEAVYIKVEESVPLNDISVVKLEPQT